MTNRNIAIGCAAAFAATLVLIFGGGYLIYRFYTPAFERPQIPEQLKRARIIVNTASLVKSTFIESKELGEIKSMAYGELDPSPGPELVIVGQTGALFTDENGNVKSHLWFVEHMDRHWGIKIHGSKSRFGDIQIVDVNGDHICEFLVRNSFGEAELIGHNGQTIWTYTGTRRDEFLEDMTAGDIDRDGEAEYIVAYLNGKGLVLLDKSLNEIWNKPDVHSHHVEVAEIDGDGHPTIIHDDSARIVLRDYNGNIVEESDTGHYIGSCFSVARGPTKKDKPHLLYSSDGVIRLVDSHGKSVVDYLAPLSESFCKTHGVTVKFNAHEREYFAVVVEESLFQRSILYIYNAAGNLVYQEVLAESCASIAAAPLDKTETEVLLLGAEEKVLEYRMKLT